MKITRRSRSRSRKACRSRKAGRNAGRSRNAGRKACRSTRRRMGGAHMTVTQPYDYVNFDDSAKEFDVEIDPDIENTYKSILRHRYNRYSNEMAPTFADQQNGDGKYIVVFNDQKNSATIQPRNNDLDLDARLAALYDE